MDRRIDLTSQQASQLKDAELQAKLAKWELMLVLRGILAAASIDQAEIKQADFSDKPYLMVAIEQHDHGPHIEARGDHS